MEKGAKPKFSIVIPNYNSSGTIRRCMDAVLAMEHKSYEVIVVDDHSRDGSAEIIESYAKRHGSRLRLIRLAKNGGAAYARNVGVSKARGEVIMFTDTDIINSRETLAMAEQTINSNSGASAYVGIFSPELEHKNMLSNYKHLYLCYYFARQDDYLTTLNTSLTFIKKHAFKKIGGFNSKFGVIGGDVELGTRLAREGHRILLCRNLKMKHLKRYTLASFTRDEVTRARKMFRIFLEAKLRRKSSQSDKAEKQPNSYKLKPIDLYISLAITAFAIFSACIYAASYLIPFSAMALVKEISLYAIFAAAASFVFANLRFWGYLKSERGLGFAMKAPFITAFDMCLMLFGMGIAIKDTKFT